VSNRITAKIAPPEIAIDKHDPPPSNSRLPNASAYAVRIHWRLSLLK